MENGKWKMENLKNVRQRRFELSAIFNFAAADNH
jgi:hypothetical protein